jgi:hypothetical protein
MLSTIPVDNDEGLMAGKPLGRVAMTATERQRRWRAKICRQKYLLAATNRRDRAGLRPSPARNDGDFWRTTPDLAAALVGRVLPSVPDGVVWECAAGDGILLDALRDAGRVVIAADIEPGRSFLAINGYRPQTHLKDILRSVESAARA